MVPDADVTKIESQRVGVGSLIQIAATGPQDDILYLNESITELDRQSLNTPFSLTHKRHTHFQRSEYSQNFFNPCKFDSSNKLKIEPLGDLVGNFMLEISLPPLQYKVTSDTFSLPLNYDNLEHAFINDERFYDENENIISYSDLDAYYVNDTPIKSIKNIQFTIDGNIISEYTTDFLLFQRHSVASSKLSAYDTMTGHVYTNDNLNGHGGTYYIEIPFMKDQWFPIAAISKSQFEIIVNFDTFQNITHSDNGRVSLSISNNRASLDVTPYHVIQETIDVNVLMEYIQLDTIEKNKFIYFPLEYVIAQPVYQEFDIVSNICSIDMECLNPVESLYFHLSSGVSLQLFQEGNMEIRNNTLRFFMAPSKSNIDFFPHDFEPETYDITLNNNLVQALISVDTSESIPRLLIEIGLDIPLDVAVFLLPFNFFKKEMRSFLKHHS